MFINEANSQISSSNIVIITNIYKYSYSSQTGNYNYKSSLNFYNDAQATLQARYDYYWDMLNNSWASVKNCTLINEYNIAKTNNKKIAIQNKMTANDNYKHVDWAANGAFAESLSAWITDVFNDSGVKSEIKLLKAINSEYRRLKKTYPDDFYKKDRYLELSSVLTTLKTCLPSEIDNLSMKYGLW